MRLATLSLLSILGTSLAYTLPTDLTQFYLVTTSQSTPSTNSSQLQGVSATAIFAEDPVLQSYLLLRLIGPGYASLPNFTLVDGTLSTIAAGPHGQGSYKYNSTVLSSNSPLKFLPSVQPAGNIALDGGYLLTVGGEKEGWTICEGALGQRVLYWKGANGTCAKTYLHAVREVPYRKP